MLDWISKKDQYEPAPSDVTSLLNKSVLRFLSVSSRIRTENIGKTGSVYRVSPFLKVITTFFIIISVSLSRSTLYCVFINGFSFLILFGFCAKDLKKILYVPFFAAIFSGVILLPALIIYPNGANSLMIVLKVFTTVLAINIYVHSTDYYMVTSSLRSLLIPDMVILLMDISFRYIVIFGTQASELLTAIKLRSIGRDKGIKKALFNSVGVLFIKTKNSGESLYNSMILRGFNGKYFPNKKSLRFSRHDLYYASLFVIFVLFGYLI